MQDFVRYSSTKLNTLNKNIKELKKNYPNLKITKLDYDLDEEEVIHYSVGKILPVLITKIDNKETNRLIGEKKYKEIKIYILFLPI